MDVILFEYWPPIIILILLSVYAYYSFKLLYNMTKQVKHAKTITDVVSFIIGALVLSIMLAVLIALVIEDIV